MSLSTIMSEAGLSGYAIAGLIAFTLVFATILIRLWLQGRTGTLDADSGLPLDDGRPAASPEEPTASRDKERT